MAKLAILLSDFGNSIPLSGSVNWDVAGSANVDVFQVQAGTAAQIRAGAGVDVVEFQGSSADYQVRLSGTNAVFTHTASGNEVAVQMTTEGDEVAFNFGASARLSLKIITDSGSPKFQLGDQVLDANDAPITGGDESAISVDGQGTSDIPVDLDASTGAFQFTDQSGVANNVRITGYGTDDTITVLGATATDYDSAISSNEAGDVTLAFNNNGTLNSIVLVGVAAGTVVFDVASFNALPVGDLLFV